MIRELGVSPLVIDANQLSMAGTGATEEHLDAVEQFVSWPTVLFRSSEDGATFVPGHRASTGNFQADGIYEALPASMGGESPLTAHLGSAAARAMCCVVP